MWRGIITPNDETTADDGNLDEALRARCKGRGFLPPSHLTH